MDSNTSNEIGSALSTVSSAQKLIKVFSVMKKLTITATAIYVIVMAINIYRKS